MYEYEKGQIPDLPPDYEMPIDPTETDLLKQVIDNQEKIIEFMYYDLQTEKDGDQYEVDRGSVEDQQHSETLETLQLLIDQATQGDSSLQDSNTQTLEKLDQIKQELVQVQAGSNTVLTYGVLYIPLAIIIFLLYRFFWAFLKTYR